MAAMWTVRNMERAVSFESKDDVVTTLHWECTDNDGEHMGRSYGSVSLDTSDLSSFTAFADITEDKAIEWAKAALGEETVKNTEDSVADQIVKSKTPENLSGVSWAKAEA